MNKKIDKLKEFANRMFQEGTAIEDKEATAKLINPFRMEITPKGDTDLDELHNKFVKKLNRLGLLKYVTCYTYNGKIYLEKLVA